MIKRLVIFLFGAAVLLTACSSSQPEGQSGQWSEQRIISEAEQEQQAYIVNREEYDFFKSLYEKDTGNEPDDQELRNLIAYNHAEFYLSVLLGIRQDDSYEGLKQEWEQENDSRSEKLKSGEVFYGPSESECLSYYEYIHSNPSLENIEKLSQNADEQMDSEAEAYFEEHKEDYQEIQSIKCILSDGEKKEEKEFTYSEIRSLQKTNDALLQFLLNAEKGEVMEIQQDGRLIRVEFVSMSVTQKQYSEIKSTVMQDYIENQYYDGLVNEIAEAIPISYETEE